LDTYRDISVLAFPTPIGGLLRMADARPVMTVMGTGKSAALAARGVDMLTRLHQSRKAEPALMWRIGNGDYLADWKSREESAEKQDEAAMAGHHAARPAALPRGRTGRPVSPQMEPRNLLQRRQGDDAHGAPSLPDAYMARKELLAFLTAHNLVSLMTAKAALLHGTARRRSASKALSTRFACPSRTRGLCRLK
jgi:hypothetical protein